MFTPQEFGSKFERYLLEHVAQLGLTCILKPLLPDGKTPDFWVEHEGRACYVEATHMHGPDEFREKRGEEDLKELLEKGAPGGWGIVLQYPYGEDKRLTDPISKKDRAIREVVEWLSTVAPSADGQTLKLEVRSVQITLQAYAGPTAEKATVGWIKSHGKGGLVTERYEGFRDSLRRKYNKYTAGPESLGDIPLIIAIFDETLDEESVGEAVYGTTRRHLNLETRQPRTETLCDGVWLNNRSGELEARHNHLVGVWHFQSMKDRNRTPAFFANPNRQDLDTVIPKPILADQVSTTG